MALIHYYPLDETSGNTFADTIGGETGTVLFDPDGLTAVPALFGYGRDFQVTGSYAELTDGDDRVTNYSEWSLTCWIRRDGGSESWEPPLWFLGGNYVTTETVDTYLGMDGTAINMQLRQGSTLLGTWSAATTLFDNQWHLIVITCDGTTTRVFVDNVEVITAAAAVLLYPLTNRSWFGDNYQADDLAIFSHEITSTQRAALWNGGAGNPVLGEQTPVESPLQPPSVFLFNDWAAAADSITSTNYYALEIDDGVLDPLRIPISSWQATVQTGRASYAQAVIPAATQWVDAVNARADGEMIIYRGVRFSNGQTQESELARAPLQDVRLDRGPINATMTTSGYAQLPASPPSSTRILQNVRSESIGRGLRVRCDIDFFLRPGHTASARGTEFVVSYINYYANSADEYMDVGEQVL